MAQDPAGCHAAATELSMSCSSPACRPSAQGTLCSSITDSPSVSAQVPQDDAEARGAAVLHLKDSLRLHGKQLKRPQGLPRLPSCHLGDAMQPCLHRAHVSPITSPSFPEEAHRTAVPAPGRWRQVPAGSLGVLAPPLAQVRPLLSVRYSPLGTALSMGSPLPVPGSMPGLIPIPVPQCSMTPCAADLTVVTVSPGRCTDQALPCSCHTRTNKRWPGSAQYSVQDGTHTFNSTRSLNSAQQQLAGRDQAPLHAEHSACLAQ